MSITCKSLIILKPIVNSSSMVIKLYTKDNTQDFASDSFFLINLLIYLFIIILLLQVTEDCSLSRDVRREIAQNERVTYPINIYVYLIIIMCRCTTCVTTTTLFTFLRFSLITDRHNSCLVVE